MSQINVMEVRWECLPDFVPLVGGDIHGAVPAPSNHSLLSRAAGGEQALLECTQLPLKCLEVFFFWVLGWVGQLLPPQPLL